MDERQNDTSEGSGRSPLTLRTAFALQGATALTVQILLLRELMVAWRGNEMSFGVSLSVWLGLTGLGSALYGALAGRIRPTRRTLARGLLVLGLLAPVALLAARLARRAIGLPAGELAGLPSLLFASVASLAPFTLAAGFLFALAVAVLAGERARPRDAIGAVYILEAIGAAASGILMSFVLLPRLDPVSIALLATAASAVLALALAAPRRSGRRCPGLSVTAAIVAGVASLLAVTAGSRIDDATVAASWRSLGFRSQTNSIYGRIVAAEIGSQKSVYESGVLVASSPDRLAAEEAVHLTLLSHPRPSRVLLLGGGLAGTVEEILKHPSVTAVDYVELDPALVRAAGAEFGAAMTAGLDDPRVTVHFTDARFFVKRRPGPYDVVVANVPDPTTAQLNRFYTTGFFREVSEILSPGGVFGLSVTSSENYIGRELGTFLASLKRTIEDVYPAVVMIPGDPCHFVASAGASARAGSGSPSSSEPPPEPPAGSAYLTRDPEILARRIAERRLDVVFVRDYYLADRLSEERRRTLDEGVGRQEAPANTDLSPTALYLSMVLWNRQFSRTPTLLSAAPRYLTVRNAAIVGLALVLLLGVPALARRRAPTALRRNVLVAVFVVGLTEISLEIAALLAFQSLYGYVYHRLAAIVAAFMAGLALGGWLGTLAARRGAGARAFAVLQLAIACVPIGLAFAVARVAALPHDALLLWADLFPLIVVGSAVLAGMQFPLAAGLYHRTGHDAGAAGGRLYGADLLGAAVGATAAAVFLLPVMGIPLAMASLAVLNVAVLVCLAIPILAGAARG